MKGKHLGSLPACAENRGSDPHMRGAKLGGNSIIGAHAHAQPGQRVARGDLGQQRKMRRRVVFGGRDAHQPINLQAMSVAAFFDKPVRIMGRNSSLLGLFAGVDLNQEFWLTALSGDFPRERRGDLRPVDSFDHIKQRDGFARLVRLQRPDQTQFNIRKARAQVWPFSRRFLNAIFAKNPVPRLKRRKNARRVLLFGYCGDRHRSGRAARLAQRRLEFLLDCAEISGRVYLMDRRISLLDRIGHQGLRMRAASLAASARRLKQRSNAAPAFHLAFMTDRRRIPNPLPVIRVLPPGAAVILRDYDMRNRKAFAAQLKSVCAARRQLLLIGADMSLARLVQADGVHWPSWGPSWAADQARPGLNFIISAACHNAADLARAHQLGADIALLSPVFPTKSHPDAPALGPDRFSEIAAAAPLPVLALGGVDEANAKDLAGPNVAGLAAISAFVS